MVFILIEQFMILIALNEVELDDCDKRWVWISLSSWELNAMITCLDLCMVESLFSMLISLQLFVWNGPVVILSLLHLKKCSWLPLDN